jgi:hypothetical protein
MNINVVVHCSPLEDRQSQFSDFALKHLNSRSCFVFDVVEGQP